MLNARSDWPEYERVMLNVAKQYGDVERTLATGTEAKFEMV